jgi:hypothetical protein
MKHVEGLVLERLVTRLAHEVKAPSVYWPSGWCYLLANLGPSGVCLASQSRAVEIYPKSGRTMVRGVAGPYSVAGGTPTGDRSRVFIIFIDIHFFIFKNFSSLPFGRCRYSRLEREKQVTTPRERRDERCGARKSVDPSMLPNDRKLGWDWGYVTHLRVVYYHLRMAGTFPTPSQCSQRRMAIQASENLVLRHERQRAGTEGPDC